MSDKPTFRFLEEAEADFHEGLRYYVKHDRVVAERFDGEIVSIIAVAHHSRDPESWEHRR